MYSYAFRMSTKAADTSIGFLNEDFNDGLFTELVKNISPKYRFVSFKPIGFTNDSGVTSGLIESGGEGKVRVIGFRAFTVTYCDDDSKTCTTDVVFKVKAKGDDIWQSIIANLRLGGETAIANNYSQKTFDCFYATEAKEMAVAQVDTAQWKALMPDIYWFKNDPSRDIYVIAMEDLRKDSVTHLNTIVDVSRWSTDDINCALEEMASFHALYYGKTDQIPANVKAKLTDYSSIKETYTNDVIATFLKLQLESNISKCSELMNGNILKIVQSSLKNIDQLCAILDSSPLTLVHNDFSVRNSCLRKNPRKDQSRLCVFDWEVVRVANPQHDVIEFLAFVLPENGRVSAWKSHCDVYRNALLKELAKMNTTDDIMSSVADADRFQQVFDMSALEFAWNRIGTYMRVHTVMFKLPFMSRLASNTFRYIESIASRYSFLAAK